VDTNKFHCSKHHVPLVPFVPWQPDGPFLMCDKCFEEVIITLFEEDNNKIGNKKTI
jgi:hypothetical protein